MPPCPHCATPQRFSGLARHPRALDPGGWERHAPPKQGAQYARPSGPLSTGQVPTCPQIPSDPPCARGLGPNEGAKVAFVAG